MRILVFSDAHGGTSLAEKAIFEQPNVDEIIFLGDGAAAVEEMASYCPKRIHILKGNCDFMSDCPNLLICEMGGKKIFASHGHMYGVKSGLGTMIAEARREGADIMLYGHTHEALCDYNDGLYIMNPGSLSRGNTNPSYGVIDITSAGILMSIIKPDY